MIGGVLTGMKATMMSLARRRTARGRAGVSKRTGESPVRGRLAVSIVVVALLVGFAVVATAEERSRRSPEPQLGSVPSSTVVFGVPVEVDAEQTADEAEAARRGPIIDFPEELLAMAPASQAAVERSLELARRHVEGSLEVDRFSALIDASSVRAFVSGVLEVELPQLEHARGPIAVVAYRTHKEGEVFGTTRRGRPGSTNAPVGDTLVTMISGPERIEGLAILDWDQVSSLLSAAHSVAADTVVLEG